MTNQTNQTATAPMTAADYLTTKDDGFPKEEGGRIYADAYDLIGTETVTAPTTAEKRIDIYTIGVTRSGASLNRDYHVAGGNSYAEAVQEARNLWNLRRQSVTVHSGTDVTYWYHRIAADGISEDRN